jgi:hypothetical protein
MQFEKNSLKNNMPDWERNKTMTHDLNWKALKKDKVNITFNMGLEIAVFILEMAEGLSPEGRKCLIDELKRNIGQSEER